jgi:hypothetical protein
MNSFRDFFQRTTVCVNPYEELVGVLAGTVVSEESVPGPNINRDSVVERSDEIPKECSIYLSKGLTTNEG